MEGEAEKLDLSFFFQLFHIRDDTQIQDILPFFFVQAVKQVEVHIIHIQTVKLFLENTFCVIQGFYIPYGQFGCQIEAFAVVFFQDFSYKGFAVAVVVWIGCVYVGDSGLKCAVQHSLSFRLVDISVRCLRKAHAAKAFQSKWFH